MECAYEKPLMVALYLLVTFQPLASAFDAALQKAMLVYIIKSHPEAVCYLTRRPGQRSSPWAGGPVDS